MLAKVGVDSKSLCNLHPEDQVAEIVSHRALLDVLLDHGVIVFGHSSDEQKFFAALENLPGQVKALWRTALERLPAVVSMRRIEKSLAELIDQGGSLSTTWGGAVSIVLAEGSRAAMIGLPETAAAVIDSSGIEIVRMDTVHGSTRLTRMRQLAGLAIHKGEDREAVWRERFRPVAHASGHVCIVDRYALAAHRRRLANNEESGLRWIIERLASDGVRHIHLICDAARRYEGFQDLLHLQATLKHSPASLSITFVKDNYFKESGHARHIRFDSWAFSLDKGCDLFSPQLVPEESPCQFGDFESVRRRERFLEQSARAEDLRVRVWP